MTWMVVIAVVAGLVGVANSDAGHFFAETPKNLPRIGRRGDLPALTTLVVEEDTRHNSRPVRGVPEALARVDLDEDGCINMAELLRIPVVKVAVLLQNPALLSPDAVSVADHEEKETGDAYTTDQRPNPRLLHFLQK